MTIHLAQNKSIKFILSVLFFLSFLNVLKPITFTSWPDFAVYYQTAQHIFHHAPSANELYLYPPVSLLLFFLFTFFSYIVAGRVWFIISLICLTLSVWLFLKLYTLHKNIVAWCIAGILVCNFFPVKFTFGMGQINMVILLLITLAFTKLISKSNKFSGVLWGSALLLKYFPICIPLYFFFRKQWDILLWMVVTIGCLFIVGFIVLSPPLTIHFFQNTFPSLATSLKSDYYNQALSGFLLRSFHFPEAVFLLMRLCISGVLLLITYFVLRTKKFSKELMSLEISIFITLSLLLNSFSWQHHFVFLLLPLGITYMIIKQHQLSWQYYIVLLLSYILICVNAKNPHSLPTIFQSHVFIGTVLFWGLNLSLISVCFKNMQKTT